MPGSGPTNYLNYIYSATCDTKAAVIPHGAIPYPKKALNFYSNAQELLNTKLTSNQQLPTANLCAPLKNLFGHIYHIVPEIHCQISKCPLRYVQKKNLELGFYTCPILEP